MVALVTGSGRGIGEALAVGLAQAGADVAVSDLPERMAEANGVQARIEELGRRSATYPMDVQVIEEINTGIIGWLKSLGGWISWSTMPAFAVVRPRWRSPRKIGMR